jgi:Na+/melibiose symporter-like transporter
VALVLGWLAWSRALRPRSAGPQAAGDIWQPWRRPAFRRLLAVFVLNGIASAVPATLVLFFVQDRLQAPKTVESAVLAVYFLCAAVSIPAWLRLVARIGLARAWLTGILLAVAAFVGASQLGAGDVGAFLVVCALSGLALGTDLALPGALLAGVIAQAGDRGRSEGAYFGWWNFATKLNLALAAGLALPLLGLFGYAPGARDAAGLQALTIAYCLLPCGLKLGAGLALYLLVIRAPTGPLSP